MIDLHLHTTASDGRCTPRELVEQAAAARLTVMAVTDHDTTAAVYEVQTAARARGIDAVAGIEVTGVERGFDVHILGYFVEPDDAALQTFLSAQRASRVARAEEIARRLLELGLPIDADAMLAAVQGQGGKAIGRPQVARAMIAAGHVADISEAFEKWLSPGRPAFVSRTGPSPETVIATIHAAGGLASLAHPGRTRIDGRIPSLREAGLDAIEVFHSDHGPEEVSRYRRMAADLDCLITGGSDYHGDPARAAAPGCASLPFDEWQRLAARGRHGG